MRTASRRWAYGAAAVAAVVVLVLAFFDWNWLRGPVSRYVSNRLDRPFAINGNLHVDLSLSPLVRAEQVTLGNAAWSSEPTMASADRVGVRFELLPLFVGRVVLPEITLAAPRLLLERNAEGRANWQFRDTPPAAAPLPAIGRLSIDDGFVHFRDPVVKSDVTVAVASVAPGDAGGDAIEVRGKGSLRGEPFTLEGRGATPLALEHRDRPYDLDVRARAGATSAHYKGTIVPSRLDAVDGALSLQGKDLSQLYPIVPVPLPWTPAYSLNGQLRHDAGVWTFKSFRGKVGNSDLAGDFVVDRTREKPLLKAELISQRLDYQDLGGFVGLPPAHQAAAKRTPAQNQEVAKRARTDRVLPTRRFEFDRLLAANASVHFKGVRVIATDLPLDNMDAKLELQDGVLKLQPLDFGFADGHVVSRIVVDATTAVPKLDADITVRNVELEKVMPKLKPPRGNAGKFGGRVRVTAAGRSMAEWLASSNGGVSLISRGGQASEITIVLSNLDLARAAQLLLRGDENSPIRCAVADFAADHGRWLVQTLVADTEAELITGQGAVDFQKEQYELRLEAHSKRPSLVALRGPIVVEGSFGSPRVGPAIGPLAARVGASVALGTALTPLAALLPLIDLGGSPDADCAGLIAGAQGSGRKDEVARR